MCCLTVNLYTAVSLYRLDGIDHMCVVSDKTNYKKVTKSMDHKNELKVGLTENVLYNIKQTKHMFIIDQK